MRRKVDELLERTQRETYRYGEYQFKVTVSVGLTKKLPGQTLESMLKKADQALYRSKGQGRNRFTSL